MANGNAKKHKCSCGRAFRHAISLKRHQKVAGCEAAPEVEAEVAAPAEAAPVEEEAVARAEITADEGRQVLRFALAAEESARLGRTIEFSPSDGAR